MKEPQGEALIDTHNPIMLSSQGKVTGSLVSKHPHPPSSDTIAVLAIIQKIAEYELERSHLGGALTQNSPRA